MKIFPLAALVASAALVATPAVGATPTAKVVKAKNAQIAKQAKEIKRLRAEVASRGRVIAGLRPYVTWYLDRGTELNESQSKVRQAELDLKLCTIDRDYYKLVNPDRQAEIDQLRADLGAAASGQVASLSPAGAWALLEPIYTKLSTAGPYDATRTQVSGPYGFTSYSFND